jgi:hypothetical protein
MEVYKSTQPLKDETTGKYFYPQICVDQIYPVGSIYLSVNNVNPANLFGGTWEQLKDRFLLGAGDTYSAGSSGGEATHTLTISEMPSHNHALDHEAYATLNNSGSAWTPANANTASEYYTRETGGSQPHNNMPPYLTVYMWQRIS